MISILSRTAGANPGGGALAAALLAAASVQLSACGSEPGQAEASSGAGAGQAGSGGSAEQAFYISTLHLDGKTNVNGAGDHAPEPFPATAPPSSGGFIVRPPDNKGEWSVRAFAFHPSQVIVHQGDTVALNFMGVQGPSHTIAVDGQPQLSLKRGELKTVRFVAERPGVIGFSSVGREPTMRGSVLVLPRGAGEGASR